MRRHLAVLTLAAFVTSCTVGPKYKRPDVVAPPQFRGAEANPTATSLGELKWFDLFQDEALRKLIQQALAANYNVLIAAQRVEEAQGQLQATRSALFPQLNAQGVAARQGTKSPTQSSVGGFGVASWEIDLFGKIRRATEAARADLLALQDNQAAVSISLVSQVASAYFDLLEYDAELQYVRESIVQRNASVNLVRARLEGGVGSRLDLDQALSLVYSAQASAALLERGIEQTENLINFLLAKPPGPVERGKALTAQYQPPQVPAGLPSALLDRRPDVRASEQQLIAANARVGEAKAAFFPSITLTGAGGYQTTDLLGVINRSGLGYSVGGTVDLPIFDAGRRQGNYKTAKAFYQEILVGYQQAINGAFHDVSDSLIAYQKAKEYRLATQQFTDTLRDQSRLANLRYRGGVSSYLEVLDTERQRLTGEQQLAQAQRDELLALVQLYKSLGGGWQI
jgi:NodT family efflux transporter outer membrane factor (OMF) lipoprotein